MKKTVSYSVLVKNDNGSNTINRDRGPNELDKSGHSIKSVLSALSMSIHKTLSKPGDSKSSKNSGRNRGISAKDDVSEIPEELQDEYRIYRSLQDAGRNTDGVDAVEVWILDKSEGKLVQPPGGFWHSPYFVADDYEALARISDREKEDYVPPPPLLPGTGLAGTLWNEERNNLDKEIRGRQKGRGNTGTFGYYSRQKNAVMAMNQSFERGQGQGQESSLSSHSQSSSIKSFQSMTNMLQTDYRQLNRTFSLETDHGLAWRDIRSVNIDPYMPTFLRLELMEVAGFKKCTGIHFDIQGTSGIVLFLAKDDMRVRRLNRKDNVAYMKASANFVGAAVALVKHRIRLSARINLPQSARLFDTTNRESFYSNIVIWLKKFRGGDLQPPPPMSFDESALTFFGAFTTLLVLHWASDIVESIFGVGFIFGPFGALLTLQFGLTMAPPAQPRNVLGGQIAATIFGLLIPKLLGNYMEKDMTVSMTTAMTIAFMVKLGIPHPPAGATALIISSGNYGWDHILIVFISNSIAICMSTMINNLSQKRQYPTYIHMGEHVLYNLIFGWCVPKNNLSSGSYDKSTLTKRSHSPLVTKEASFTPPYAPIQTIQTIRRVERLQSRSSSPRDIEDPSKPMLRVPSILKDSTIAQSIGQSRYMNPSTILLEPMDRSGGAMSCRSGGAISKSSNVQKIIGDEENGELDINLIQNEISSQHSWRSRDHLQSVTSRQNSDVDAPIRSVYTSNRVNNLDYESQEIGEMQHNRGAWNALNQPKMELTYGSMFMMPTTLESHATTHNGTEGLDDDLSLESFEMEF